MRKKSAVKENGLVVSLIFATAVVLGIYFDTFMIAVVSTIGIVLAVFGADFVYSYQRNAKDEKSIKELDLDPILLLEAFEDYRMVLEYHEHFEECAEIRDICKSLILGYIPKEVSNYSIAVHRYSVFTPDSGSITFSSQKTYLIFGKK